MYMESTQGRSMMRVLSGLCSNSTLPYSLQHNNKNPTKLFLSCSSSSSLVSLKIRRNFTKGISSCCFLKAQQSQLNCSYTEEESKTTQTPTIRRKKLALFVSGGGSNFRSIHHACLRGLVHAEVVVLVTNNPGCGGSEFARNEGIPVITFPKSKDVSLGGLSPTELVSLLRNMEVDFILLAGYLKLIPSELVQAYPKSILNIHPALLPAFGGKGYYGMKVHQAVIASGARYSGPTIHFVDDHYDTGRILAQRVVPVLANDTAEDLAARVLKEEHKLYVDVASALCEERIIWREDGVPLIQSKDNPSEYA